MKKITSKESIDDYELLPEYRVDYSKAKPNRFAKKFANRKIIVLDADVAKIFQTDKQVNAALRAIVDAFPKTAISK